MHEVLTFPFYRWENWATEIIDGLLKIICHSSIGQQNSEDKSTWRVPASECWAIQLKAIQVTNRMIFIWQNIPGHTFLHG